MKIPNILEDRFVAFIDILGFKGIVNNIENGSECFDKILSALNFLDEETQESRYGSDLPIYELQDDKVIERELGDPRLTYVSDCIIISTEPTLNGFKALSNKIHKITSDLSFDGILCRGAITKGKLFHRDRILFGTSYIRAYQLETEAKFPRIIVDPDIIGFFRLKEGEVPIGKWCYGLDKDGLYYQRYWTWQKFPPYAYDFISYLMKVRQQIVSNLDKFGDNEKILPKYIWIKNEFNDLITWWTKLGLINHKPYDQIRII